MGFKEWAQKRVTAGAIAARDRGDTVYVKQLANLKPAALSMWINRIEGVGWKLEHQEQTRVGRPSANRRFRQTLTFRRVDEPSA